MSLLQRAKAVTGDLPGAGKRQALRAKREVEVRRIERKIGAEKNAIGHALFPLLESGTLHVDIPEVQDHLQTIADLMHQIEQNRAPGEVTVPVNRDETAADLDRSDRDTWADDGGPSPMP